MLFHSVVFHCDSVVVRGFPFGFTVAPQIFGVDFFVFGDPKKGSKRTFWVRYVLGPAFFGCSTQCRPYFCSVLRVRNSIRFGSSAFSVFFLGPSFLFFDGVKNLIWGVGKKNVARVIRGLWLGIMMMGASWDILTFQCRHT